MVQHSLRLCLWTWSPALTGQQVSIPLHKHCAHLLLKENININTAFIYLVLLAYKKVREEYIEVKVSQPCHFRENSSIYLEGDEERIAVFCELNISVKGISDVYFLSPRVISRRCHMYLHTHTRVRSSMTLDAILFDLQFYIYAQRKNFSSTYLTKRPSNNH